MPVHDEHVLASGVAAQTASLGSLGQNAAHYTATPSRTGLLFQNSCLSVSSRCAY